jgi:hypothetical protein
VRSQRVRPVSDGRKITSFAEFDIIFECSGKKGDVITVARVTDHLFRCDQLVMADTRGGDATLVRSIFIDTVKDGENVTRANLRGSFPSKKFDVPHSADSLYCRIRFDVVRAGGSIKFEVEFLEDCEWSAVMFGRVVLL